MPALKELLELTTDDLWLLMENSAGAGGTIGRSTDELAAIHDALDHHPRLGLCLDSCHWYVSGVDVTDKAVLDAAIAEIDGRIGLDRLRCLHVNDSKAALGSNLDRHETTGAGLIGDAGLRTFLAHPAFQELPAILETPGPTGTGPMRPRSPTCGRCTAPEPRTALNGRTQASAIDLREDAEARSRDRHLEELGVPAAHLVAALLVTRSDLRVTHRQGRPARNDRTEAVTSLLGGPQKVEIDLHVEHPLHAAHVGVPERLVRVDERTRALDAGARVHDLVAVHLAAATRDLVLRSQRELDGGRRRGAIAHLRGTLQEVSAPRKT